MAELFAEDLDRNATGNDLRKLSINVDLRFTSVDRRFDAVDRRFDAVDRRFATMETRLDERFDAVDRRFDVGTDSSRSVAEISAVIFADDS